MDMAKSQYSLSVSQLVNLVQERKGVQRASFSLFDEEVQRRMLVQRGLVTLIHLSQLIFQEFLYDCPVASSRLFPISASESCFAAELTDAAKYSNRATSRSGKTEGDIHPTSLSLSLS